MSVAEAHGAVESVCNQLANMIAHLKEIAPEFYAGPEIRGSAVLSEEYQAEIFKFLDDHPEISDPETILCDGFPAPLEDAIRGWEYYNEPVPFFHLLLEMEGKLDIEELLKLIGEDSFTSLNSNRNSTGIYILPRVRSILDPLTPAGWEEEDAPPVKHWAEEWDIGINQDLKNIFYIERDALTARGAPYTIRNRVLTAPILEGKRELLIALSPLMSNAVLDKRYGRSEYHGVEISSFSVQGIKNAHQVHKRFHATFVEACQRSAGIAVFPEMLGDAGLLEPDKPCSDAIAAMIREAEDQERPAPYLTLIPTWWHDGQNELYVISNGNERLCVQQKQHSFTLEENGVKYMEELAGPNREIQILHIDGLGRFTFPICKDLLVQDYSDLLIRRLHSTFVICPSFSPKKTQFKLTSLKGRPYGCYVIWLNTCSATEKKPPEYLGWITCPYSEEIEHYLYSGCQGNCGGDSDICLFLIRISLDGDPPEVTVEPHIQTSSA